MHGEWVGVDLDGTLAVYDGWHGRDHIGEPVESILFYVKDLLETGIEVRIFTARASMGPKTTQAIEAWCLKHVGQVLPITDRKDGDMVFCLDDRAIAVEMNTGFCRGFVDTSLEAIAEHCSPTNGNNPNGRD
jgi:hypothetical protein